FRSDLALYKAKEQGKNQYVFYNKALDKQRCFDEEIENDLKNALEKKELTLHYQAQYNTQGQLFGFESLLRWNNEKYKKIPIINIISIIEKTTLIDDIGDFILEEAFSFSKKINIFRENKIVISVNISALQIMKSNFVKNIKKILNKIDVDPKIVGIEITETVLLKNIEENLLKIKELKDIGITISLDDFGTGYSSFCYLVKLPLTNIKLDKNFIWGMKDSDEYKTLVKLCVDTAHALNLKIVAEGVETTEELDILKKMNVDFIQGYLFSKPIPENKVIELLKIGSIPNLV
ncbi:EAL domain-containing protein, partial [uncultured Cetobacterium sp.]|uniref:EAL domain-containing protein n=1 Tax=uncultured Cetobacterium sp. TaxID=527638 RepID=UPI0026092F13